MKKILSLMLAIVLAVSFAGCGQEEQKQPEATQAPIQVIQEPEQSLAENTLHKVSVTETSRSFVTNGQTEYAIVTAADEQSYEAANFIAKHISAATGATVPVLESNTVSWTEAGKYIFVNCPEQFTAAGLTMPAEDIGQRGYHIKSAGDSVFIATRVPAGTQLGAIAFLRYVLGYDMLSAGTVLYEKDGTTLPDMDITERPDYDFYISTNKLDSATLYGMGYQDQLDVFVRVTSPEDSNGMYHNSLQYLPYNQYSADHPGWYSDVTYGTAGERELCYTAHGDEEELSAMVDVIAHRMLLESNNNPHIATICLTIEDHNTVCNCEACTASSLKYDGSNSAAVIQLLNRVNKKVQAQLQAQADADGTEKRELNILFFAYHKMLKAPARKNAAGQWEPIDETVVCDKEVGVFYAPIEAYYTYTFTHDNNTDHRENTKAWGSLAEKIYMWTYCTNFGYYLYPYNTFDAMVENFRFFKEAGAAYMYNQGQHNQGSPSHFSDFKEYVTSRALFDVNVSVAELTDTYFAGYFREAAEPMRQYFDELQAHMGYLANAYPVQLNGYIREEIGALQYWPKETLQQWLGYIEQAYAAIEPYQQTNPELYELLYKHILQESIFPRYAMLELHPGSYQAGELDSLRRQFKSDCERLGVNNVSEWVPISTVFSQWGIL